MREKKRFLSVFLSLCLCISMIPLSVFADETGQQDQRMTLQELEQELEDAAEGDKEATLTGNVMISKDDIKDVPKNEAIIEVPAGVTLNGGGYSITADDWGNENKNKCHILAVKNSEADTTTTIKSLTIIGNENTKSGIHAYNCAGTIALEGVTIKNCGNAAVQVNGSTVTATDLTTEGNVWGAINVDKGQNVQNAASFNLKSGKLGEDVKIWTELTEGDVVTVPDSWITVYGSGKNAFAPSDSLPEGAVYNETTQKYYLTLSDALSEITEEDKANVISLESDITDPVVINKKNVEIKGNDHTVKVSGTDTAIVVDADDVKLNGIKAESEHGIALVVNEGKTAVVIEGGSYKTCTKEGGYTENFAKQGEGAIRFSGDNGDITVRNTKLTGGLHILDYSAGKLDIAGNSIRFDYIGSAAFAGIVIQGNDMEDIDLEALKGSNMIDLPNGYSSYVQKASSDWNNKSEIGAPVTGVSVVDGNDGITPVTIPVVGQKLSANIQTEEGTIGSYPVDNDAVYRWHYKDSDTLLGSEPVYTVTADNAGKILCVDVSVERSEGEASWTAESAVTYIADAGYILDDEEAKKVTGIQDCDNYTMYVKYGEAFTENTHLWYVIEDPEGMTYGIAGTHQRVQAWSFNNKGQFESWPEEIEPGAPKAGEYNVTIYRTAQDYTGATGENLPGNADLTDKIGEMTIGVVAKESKVTFDAAGGECDEETAFTKNGKLENIPTPTRSGNYRFEGWYTEDGVKVTKNTVFYSDQTVTARWTYTGSSGGGGGSVTTYAVNVEDTDNGTVTVSVKSASKGSTVTLTVKPDEGYQLDKLTVTDKDGKEISVTEKEDGKYAFTMPASKVSVSAAFTKSEEKPEQIAGFTDVLMTDWFADAVQYAVDNGMMNGTSETTFRPNGTTTRGMIVTILYRLEKEPAVDNGAGFADVAADQYYADAVAWASANDIVTGYSEEKFGPDNSITREQFAAILYRYAQYKKIDVTATADLSGYADAAQISAYAETAMKWANGEGLITGVTDTMLKPAGNATRAQAATILMRFCEEVAK